MTTEQLEKEVARYKDDIKKYQSLMLEIVKRTHAIELTLTGQCRTAYKQTDLEFLALQTRNILETIAFSTLITNKDIYAQKWDKYQEHYKSKAILKEIEKFNPEFYPVPLKYTYEPGRVLINQDASTFLSRTTFEVIYDKCSNILHAENPFGIITTHIPDSVYEEFSEWVRIIKGLLTYHTIKLKDVGHHLVVKIEFTPPGDVNWMFAKET